MTETRRPLQKKSSLPKKNEERLAKALRENLYRRKVQTRSRAGGGVTGDPVTLSDTDAHKRSTGDTDNG